MLQQGQIDCYEQILPSAEPVEVGLLVPTSINRVFSSVSELSAMDSSPETDIKTRVPLEIGCRKKHSGLSVEVDIKSRSIFSWAEGYQLSLGEQIEFTRTTNAR